MEEKDTKKQESIEDLKAQKAKADRLLLWAEDVLLVLGVLVLLAACMVLDDVFQLEKWLKILLVVIGFVVFIADCAFCMLLEQKAGYFECEKCHTKYVPTYAQVCLAVHFGRTRYMTCPHCKQKSWHKKVLK